jgi:hypothetical protein
MAGLKQLEFFLLRYVPDAVKDEFVNIGVVMLEPGSNGAGFADVRFTRDWRRVRCLDPQADIEWLEALERDIRMQLQETQDREVLLRKLEDSFSNVIQLSATKACLAEEPAGEIEAVAKLYLEGQHIGTGTPSKRGIILERMEEAFERAGVLPLLLRNIAVAQYTRTGDPLKFDFGYPVGNEIKFLQALSLEATVAQAVMLGARFPQIAVQIREKDEHKQTIARLTAVVNDDLDRKRDDLRFALSMMEESQIRVAALAEMPRIAEEVRVELRA